MIPSQYALFLFVPELFPIYGILLVMNKVRVDHLYKMLDALSVKTGLTLSQKNLKLIADQIEGIGEDYLYKKIYNPIKKLRRNDTIGLRADQLDCVAKYLGRDNFSTLAQVLDRRKDPQLESLVGHYYSYVRRNASVTSVLRSPVRILKNKDEAFVFELKGPDQVFAGTIENRHGSLFILMVAKGGKAFHHVYKIGERKNPVVLQGTFSGVSTAFDPIGGRAVLIKTECAYEVMTNASLSIAELKKSGLTGEQKLAGYFAEYFNNNVAPDRSSTFDEQDL